MLEAANNSEIVRPDGNSPLAKAGAMSLGGSPSEASEAQTGCWFCSLAPTDPTNVAFFETCFLEKELLSRDPALQQILDSDSRVPTGMTIEDGIRHFGRHWTAQPFPGLRTLRSRKERDELQADLTEVDWQIIRFLAQVHLATAEQLSDLFWPVSSNSNRRTRIEKTSRRLAFLASRQLVYRRRHENQSRPTVKAYYLGKGGELLMDDQRINWAAPTKPDETAGYYLHDLGTTEAFAALYRSLGKTRLQWRERGHEKTSAVEVSMQLNNCWAGKPLTFGFLVKPQPGETDKRGPLNLRPDGFAVVGVDFENADEAPGRSATCGLPFFFECDTGSKKSFELADQIANYELLSRSGAPALRFVYLDEEANEIKVLDVPGYAIPVLTSTQAYWGSGESNSQRLAKVRRDFAKEMKRRGYKRSKVSPKLLADTSELHEYGVHTPVYNLTEPKQTADERRTFLEELFEASIELVKTGQVEAKTILNLDPTAARSFASKGEREALTKKELAEQAAEAERLEQEREAYKQEFAASQENAGDEPDRSSDELAAMTERLETFKRQHETAGAGR